MLNPEDRIALLKSGSSGGQQLLFKATKTHPTRTSSSSEPSQDTGSIYFIGTATTILSWKGVRILTDPNFLHKGDHVHLGPGVGATRTTDPAMDLDKLPPVDCILLSHYHEDHFDALVENSLNRDFPIITTPHAKSCLTSSTKEEPFQNVHALDFFEALTLSVAGGPTSTGKKPQVRVTGMPGKHVPPGPLSLANDILKAVPPINGWLIELGYVSETDTARNEEVGYRIYISGDTLLVDELKQIPEYLAGEKIDLMLVHLGGTTIPGPHLPLIMVTMDAKMGVQLMRLVDPDVTVPIHFDDYDVFLSPLKDFKQEVSTAGLEKRVVYLDRGDAYQFDVRGV